MNQYRPVTMIARTTPGTHNPRISAQTVTLRLREIGEIPPYTMYVLYAAFLFWPYIFDFTTPGDWDCVAVVERLPALHYSVDFIFLSFGIMAFIVEL